MKEGTFLPWGRFLKLKTPQNVSVGLWLEQAKKPSARQQEALPAQAVCMPQAGMSQDCLWKEPSHFPSNHLFVSLPLPLRALCQHKKLYDPRWGTITRLKLILFKIVWVRLVSPAGIDNGCPAPGWACSALPTESVWKREISGQGLLVF